MSEICQAISGRPPAPDGACCGGIWGGDGCAGATSTVWSGTGGAGITGAGGAMTAGQIGADGAWPFVRAIRLSFAGATGASSCVPKAGIHPLWAGAGALPGNGICWADTAALTLRTVMAVAQPAPLHRLGLRKPGIFSRPS